MSYTVVFPITPACSATTEGMDAPDEDYFASFEEAIDAAKKSAKGVDNGFYECVEVCDDDDGDKVVWAYYPTEERKARNAAEWQETVDWWSHRH